MLCRPFIGRLQERLYLREQRLAAGASHGGLVLVAGEAGVGKTRLVAEFSATLTNSRWKVGAGYCLEAANRPYGAILDALAQIGIGRFELAHAESKREQFETLVERLAGIAARAASILVIEDLQWADAGTLEFLAYLGPKLQRLRVLVVATFRTGDLHAEHPAHAAIAHIVRSAQAGRIDLAPLHGSELAQFIDEALAGFSLPDDARRAVAIAGDGNPFFTEELLRSAVDERTAASVRVRRSIPPTPRDTLVERWQSLDDEDRRIIAQAAVIGRTFSLSLLASVLNAEPDALLAALRRARDYQLIDEVTPAVFRFRHGLTRDAIYGGFFAAELTSRHRAIANELERLPPEEQSLEALAFHWWAAGSAPEAARYNERAGDEAARLHAHEDAIAYYERALDAGGLTAFVQGSIQEKIAHARLATVRTAESHAAFSRAADLFCDAGAFDREAACRIRAAIAAYTLRLPAPTSPLHEMLARLDASSTLARSTVHLGLAWLSATWWFPTQAAYHLGEIDDEALDVPINRLHFHNISAWVAMTVGDVERFSREHAAWVEAAHATQSVSALAGAHYNGAMCFSFLARHDRALEQVAHGLRVARASRNRNAEECTLGNATLCYLAIGDLVSARASVEGVSATTESKTNALLSSAWGTSVGCYLDDAEMIATWFDGFERAFSAEPEIESGGAYAEVLVRRGRHREAASLLHRALPDCELIRGNVTTLLAVGRYGDVADRRRARTYLERAATGSTELPERPGLALFDAIAMRRDGQSQEATQLAVDAADGFRRLQLPLLEAAALEEAGKLGEALGLFRRCGATYDVRRLERLNRSSDATEEITEAMPESVEVAAPIAASSERVRALSEREREIATLAAKGHSNNAIARQLWISIKTVEKHLGSAFVKLGVSSRTQLVAQLLVENEAPIVARQRPPRKR